MEKYTLVRVFSCVFFYKNTSSEFFQDIDAPGMHVISVP